MNDLTLFSMFMLGILGTGHCVGMCGPLVVALPGQTGRFGSHVMYHLGRMLTYVGIGGVMGGIGKGLAGIAAATGGNHLLWMAGIQACFSLLAAAFLAVFGLARLGLMREPGWMVVASPDKLPGYHMLFKSAISNKRQVEMFGLGMMLGVLPCGLSFAAFARALPCGSPLKGAALLFAFALGTVPGLLLLGTAASRIARRYQKHTDILTGLLMIYMAVKLASKAAGILLG